MQGHHGPALPLSILPPAHRLECVDNHPQRHWFAVGDPQTSLERLLQVLGRFDLLTPERMLRPAAGLVSIGDYFDFGGVTAEAAEREGRLVLGWLASHPPEQVIIIAGNHDISRVAELAFETDESFLAARTVEISRNEFAERFPRIPDQGIARRDFSSFSVAQRAMVQSLLLQRRMRLAVAGSVEGRDVLLTHAGVTERELALLGLESERRPVILADALNDYLDAAVDAVRERWEAGEPAALDLSPLHITGRAGRQGGGLLYHRPVRRDRPGVDDHGAWEFAREAPRRFEPQELPAGLLQVAGHSGHRRCVRDLPGWVEGDARQQYLAIRTLSVSDGVPRYAAGARTDEHTGLILIDPGFSEPGAPIESFELLPLDSLNENHPSPPPLRGGSTSKPGGRRVT